MENNPNIAVKEGKKGFSGLQVFGIVAGVILLTVIVTLAAVRFYFFPSPFKPVVLSRQEEQQLDVKLQRLESFAGHDAARESAPGRDRAKKKDEIGPDGHLMPEAYSEKGLSRSLIFTEREINAMIAKNTDLADKLAIDLAENLISAKMLVPVDPDFPMFGGKILRIRAGLELAYREGRPVVKLKGVSLMGVPMPNAWLGGMKNVDFVEEFSTDKGFWKAFADGVDAIAVEEGHLKIRLKE